jgi:hypothetical protein
MNKMLPFSVSWIIDTNILSTLKSGILGAPSAIVGMITAASAASVPCSLTSKRLIDNLVYEKVLSAIYTRKSASGVNSAVIPISSRFFAMIYFVANVNFGI